MTEPSFNETAAAEMAAEAEAEQAAEAEAEQAAEAEAEQAAELARELDDELARERYEWADQLAGKPEAFRYRVVYRRDGRRASEERFGRLEAAYAFTEQLSADCDDLWLLRIDRCPVRTGWQPLVRLVAGGER